MVGFKEWVRWQPDGITLGNRIGATENSIHDNNRESDGKREERRGERGSRSEEREGPEGRGARLSMDPCILGNHLIIIR